MAEEEVHNNYGLDDGKDVLITHLMINKTYCGEVVELKPSYAKVTFLTIAEMAVDEHKLIHGGFIFGAADFAAMAAVNEPNVVLVEATTKFMAPTEVGKTMIFEAFASHETTRSRIVKVVGKIGEVKVFEGEFKAVVLDRHVLKTKLLD